MKSLLCYLVLVASALAQGPFETKVDITQREGYTAATASIESMQKRVAVFMTEPDTVPRSALVVKVTTDAKHHSVYAFGNSKIYPAFKANSGVWFFFGPVGEYTLVVGLSDPEKGLHNEFYPASIVKDPTKPVDPDKPIDPPPPTGDYATLVAVVKQEVKRLNDPATAKALSEAYLGVIPSLSGKPLLECQIMVTAVRRHVLNRRGGESENKDWNSFLVRVDQEVRKLGASPSVYIKGVEVIAQALLTQ